MKRILTSLVFAALALSAGAQNWQDALTLSENNYVGTARSVGMGNALTAVGGDPGSITLNPAGGAVASYSQFFLTPGLSISAVKTQGTDPEVGLGDKVNAGFARLKMPNGGFIFSFDTGRRHGIKRHSFGFLFNATADYTNRLYASGINTNTTYAGSLASSADGYAADVLGNSYYYYNGSNSPAWVDMTGYRAGLFDEITGRPGGYIALTEVMGQDGKVYMGEAIQQRHGEETRGGRHDILINYAMDINDIVYVGANLGFPNVDYRRAWYFQESPDNTDEYQIISYSDGTSAQLQSLRMRESLQLKGTGAYMKIGVLVRPVAGLRVGAAVQTRTRMDIREIYGYSGDVQLSTGSYSASSPENDWTYSLRMPARYSMGIAYAFGSIALVSLDCEASNYGATRFRTQDEYFGDSLSDVNFGGVNQDIKDLLGWSRQIRAGFEIKPASWLALRTGYNYISSPQRAQFVNGKVEALNAEQLASMAKTNVSFGLGFSSGSFYADAALRFRFLPDQYIIPYEYYYAPDAAKYWIKEVDSSLLTPEIKSQTTCVDALLTLGWRF